MTAEPPDDDFGSEKLEQAAISLAEEREKRSRAKTPWRTLGSFVDEIEQHKNDPWISLRLVDEEIARLRAGAMAVLVGGPGSGKSTLAANLLYQHAADAGPAIMQSVELPGMEFTARTIGVRCNESWMGVLTGAVPVDEMRRVTALERFVVLEREIATLANLRLTAEAMAKAYPGQPILIAVDYVQILDNEQQGRGERDERLRVSDIVKALDALARSLGVVVIALSQMSTANAKAARGGEALGNDAGELAAETSAFNRYATVALSIGKKSDPFEDGSRTVEMSIGKWRMGEGDRVLPMREWGRSGLWRVEGPAKTAQEVRDGRDVEKAEKREKATAAQIIGILAKAERWMTRNELCDLLTGKKSTKLQLIKVAVAAGRGGTDPNDVVEVDRRGRTKYACLWTRGRAELASVPVLNQGGFDA